MSKQVFLSAFGIHTGGGRVLLNALLPRLRSRLVGAALDARLELSVDDGCSSRINLVPKSFTARLRAVNALARDCTAGDVLFCFNSLPPTVACTGRVIVYVHAPHFVGRHRGVHYNFRTRLRFIVERGWFRLGAQRVDEFWVQTSSMATALLAAFPNAIVRIKPFVDDELAGLLRERPRFPRRPEGRAVDFLYPADGVGHKNHPVLLRAWSILASRHGSACPRLLLTLTQDEMAQAEQDARYEGKNAFVVNLGPQPRASILNLLCGGKDLIFPSTAETFGLPLIEAFAAGCEILASERDFSRDVCDPAQTFDPNSAISIASAVERHLGVQQPLPRFRSAAELVEELVE